VSSAQIIRGNALALPLADDSVDLVVTSPPYFGLRSYQDGGEHYAGQIGAEPTPAEFVDALIAATREMVRVLKPSGSIWVNLGDKYASNQGTQGSTGGRADRSQAATYEPRPQIIGFRPKTLLGVPWRYAIRCIDDLGLILRAEVIWSKPNGLPESVTDRVRRSHETWFHFTRSPRYYSALDEVREQYDAKTAQRYAAGYANNKRAANGDHGSGVLRSMGAGDGGPTATNPIGKIPGSVWTIPTQPLKVPASLGIDHFAAFPMEWPRRIIQGWSPAGVCVECGEGRRPVTMSPEPSTWLQRQGKGFAASASTGNSGLNHAGGHRQAPRHVGITGYACACPEPTADTTPGVVLDPFGGTGTTALVAKVLGRHGISVDMSADYCRLAQWRTTDHGELARAMEVEKPAIQIDGQISMLDLLDGEPA
jgi:DNA modification methylase